MVAVLLIAGIALLSGGLVAIGYGIPVKEFSFGNTLIFSGTIVACTGLMLLALWIVVRELKDIARNFGTLTASDGGGLLGRGQPMLENAGREPAAQSLGPLPWQDDTAPRDRGRQNPAAAAEIAEAEQVSKPRRSLLFSSSSRKERERLQGRTSEFSAASLRPATPDLAAGPADPSQASFEDAWPTSERSRAPEPPRRRGRPPPRFATGAASTDRDEDRPAVTVLKSGIVDGMAYSLYSDGSIEAQMPEGMMRFASIDELRSHLDQRS